jgi:hypothetical protein
MVILLSMYNLRAEGVQFARRDCSACATRGVQVARRIQNDDLVFAPTDGKDEQVLVYTASEVDDELLPEGRFIILA